VALREGTRIAAAAPLAQVRAKAISLTSTFLELVEAALAGHGFTLLSPREPAERGAQVALAHPDGYAITQALIADGVIPDFRQPDIVRFGFAPLYVRHVDVHEAVRRLKRIMTERRYAAPEHQVRARVT
jgi:kynureninase